MKNSKTWAGGRVGFTLIELLVVIAIIAILAALLIPAAGVVKQKAAIRKAETELAKLQTAIEAYKAKLGHFPPDNPNRVGTNQLYYELVGCRVTLNPNNPNDPTYAPLDGAPTVTAAQFNGYFGAGVAGIVNSGSTGGSDEGGAAQQFLRDIKPGQYGEITVGATKIRVLGVKVDGPSTYMVGDLNPFRYNSSSPTNNPSTYDLWIDVVFGKKTNRVNNWRSTPIINP